jgi:hypothetical protein
MLREMTTLCETRELESISASSTSFRDFQRFIEEGYFRRRGSDGLSAPAVPPVPTISGEFPQAAVARAANGR